MNNKQIVGCMHMSEGITAEQLIHLDNLGADALYLIDDQNPANEDAVIKLIKAAHSKIDMPIFVKRDYKRLEDVKKIIYAGNTRVVMDGVLDEDYALMKEASERFGKDNVYAWIPMIQMMDEALAKNIKASGANGCFSQTLNGADILENEGLCMYVLCRKGSTEAMAKILKTESVEGIVSYDFCNDDMDLMSLKTELSEHDVSTNRFESQIPFSEFKLNSDGLIPVIVQEYKTGKVLMLAYMNEDSYNETIRSGRMTYWSRSRQELWKKGDTSGHYQYVKSLDIDCDKDTILAKVAQIGAACHTGNESCFYTNLVSKAYDDVNPMTIFDQVMNTILERKENPKEGSYTNYLFEKGIDKILKKVGEEATEIVIAAKNPDSDELKYEICDFLYHMMVLMAERDVHWKEITKELASRH